MEPASSGSKRLRITPGGKVVLGLAAGFAACGLNTGTNLLYVLSGLLFNAFLVNLWVAHLTLRGLTVERVAPPHATQGDDIALRYTVRHERGRARAFPLGLDEEPGWWLARRSFPDGPARICFLDLPPGGSSVTCPTRLGRIGRLPLLEPRLSCRAPFGLVERSRPISLGQSVLVLPRVRPLRRGLLASRNANADGLARWMTYTRERRDVVRALRDHRPGDDRRAVHWRSSARRGQLVVKEFERSAPREALVLLDLAAPRWGPVEGAPSELAAEDPPELERIQIALTLAASLFAALQRSGERTGLGIAGEGAPRYLAPAAGPGALDRARRALALSRSAPAPDLPALERRAIRGQRLARVFLITTRSPGSLSGNGALAGAQVFHVDDPRSSRWFGEEPAPSAAEGAQE